MKLKILVILLCLFGCKTTYPPSGNWTDCNSEYTSPDYGSKIFKNRVEKGFWITVLDSTDHKPVPGTWVKYGNNSEPKQTNEFGNLFLNTTSLDTVYFDFIGFDKQYFYRSDASIDSVVILMSPCTIHIVE